MRSSRLYLATRSERAGAPVLIWPGAGRDREVGDRRVLRLARAVRDDGGVAGALGQPDRLERLGERADLVHLDQDRVADAGVDAAAASRSTFVTKRSSPTSCTRSPSSRVSCFQVVPVVLGRAVLERHDREAVEQAAPERRPGPGRRAPCPRSGTRRRGTPRSSPGRARSRRRSRWPARSAASRIASIAASLEGRSGAKPPSSPTAGREPALVQHGAERVVDLGRDLHRLGERRGARRARP